jgi:hypothetical protein
LIKVAVSITLLLEKMKCVIGHKKRLSSGGQYHPGEPLADGRRSSVIKIWAFFVAVNPLFPLLTFPPEMLAQEAVLKNKKRG